MNVQRLMILGTGSLCVAFIVPAFWPARVNGGPELRRSRGDTNLSSSGLRIQ